MKSLLRFCIRFLLFAMKSVQRLNRAEWFSIFSSTMVETGWMLVLLISLRARTGTYLLPQSHYVTYNRVAFKLHSAAFDIGTSLPLWTFNRFFRIFFCPYCYIMLNLLGYPIYTESWQLHTYNPYLKNCMTLNSTMLQIEKEVIKKSKMDKIW